VLIYNLVRKVPLSRISLAIIFISAAAFVPVARAQTGAGSAAAPQADIDLSSPDGRLAITFRTVADTSQSQVNSGGPPNQGSRAPSQLVYSVSFQGKPLIDQSVLRLDLQGQRPLGSDVRVVDTSRSTTDETYRLVTGKASTVRNHYNALRVELQENSGPQRKLSIEARAYDDAVAFRYVVPEQAALREFRLAKETTEFRISKDATTYSLVLPNYRSMYESEFVKLPVSAFSNQGGVASTVLVGLPMLLEVPGVDGDHRSRYARLRRNVSGESLRELDRTLVRIKNCSERDGAGYFRDWHAAAPLAMESVAGGLGARPAD
jgi:alpha-glucosidase